ncbi:hypothetical protein [Zhongshania sp. BJYM1]|uniref:hypothetical protein n=1 Tax=Zhongshania aquatica TaxID=2965069 RepID=UPI0022B349C5|nr:hypothetical protein [Marortus sp. BJYM1]
MARARNIKPAFFTNDALAESNSPLGRLLFCGLWTLADCAGNLEWRGRRVKAQLLPYDDCDIDQLAIDLDKSGFVRFYSDGEKIYLNIPNFLVHQNPHKNERDKGPSVPPFTEGARQIIDFTSLTINRDKSGAVTCTYGSDHADSLNPIPDSLNLIPDSFGWKPGDSQSQSQIVAREEEQRMFEEFWGLYPTNIGKKQAEKAWRKLKPNKQLATDIRNNISERLSIGDWSLDKKDYIPHASTYLNNERWNDELIARSKSGGVVPINGSVNGFIDKHADSDWAKGLL